jgi:uncharacterized membrane protein
MAMKIWYRTMVLAALLLGSQMGHGGGCCESESIYGLPTESECPQISTLTYNTFGKQFMERYCTRCHSSELTGSARQGAPTFHDFDTLFGIKAVSNHIDETTAAGPASVNEGMPIGGPAPTEMERYQLGTWIACGMPE